MLGPTTPKKARVALQAAELLHWARDSGADGTADVDLRRWEDAHDNYLAAFGLTARLVDKLALRLGRRSP